MQAQQLAEQAQRAQLEAQRALQAELDAQAAAAAGEPVGGPELYGVPLLVSQGGFQSWPLDVLDASRV